MSAMTRDVVLPQLAMGMAEGSIVEWLVAEGAQVSRDQPLVSIETEKVVTELPAPSAGVVHLMARVGDKVPVETVIGYWLAHVREGLSRRSLLNVLRKACV